MSINVILMNFQLNFINDIVRYAPRARGCEEKRQREMEREKGFLNIHHVNLDVRYCDVSIGLIFAKFEMAEL